MTAINESWKRTFTTFWVSQAFSLLGSRLVQFALVWYLTIETGSATVLAMATFVALIPEVLIAPFAGALVDRWPRKRIIIISDATIALATLILAGLFFFGVQKIWHIYFILFVRALGGAFHWPAMQASTSLMVPQEHLSRIAGINQSLRGVLDIASPPLGALLISTINIQGVLAVDVLTAMIAIGLISAIFIPQPKNANGDEAVTVKNILADMKIGFQYMYTWKGMFILALMAAILNFLINPAFTLMPLLVTNYFGGGVWEISIIESTFGIGVIAGGLILGMWGGFRKKIITSFVGIIGMGVGILLVAFAPATAFYVAVMGVILTGLLNPITNGPIFAIIQANVAPEIQGRVFTMLNALTISMSPLGMLFAAPVAEFLGIQSWFLIGGMGCVVMGLAGFFIPALMNIEEQKAVPQLKKSEVA